MRTLKAATRQGGVALIVCLLMMVAVLMLGTSGAQIAIQEAKASRNERDKLLAQQSAEAALNDAALDIEHSTRIDQFELQKAGLAAGSCEAGLSNPFLGLCRPAAPDMFPVWQKIDLGSQLISVPYGYFTGRSLAAGGAAGASSMPRYLIEVLPPPATSKDRPEEAASGLFRITAIGYGAKEATQSVVQGYYRKAGSGAGRKGWLSWREILNWEHLRDVLEQE